jgi:hypothetical protein
MMAAEAIDLWSKVHQVVHEEWTPALHPTSTTAVPHYLPQHLDQLSETRLSNLMIDEYHSMVSHLKEDPTYFVRPWLPNYDDLRANHVEPTSQPAFAALVDSLPRGSPVEWWSLGFADTCVLYQAYHLDELSSYRYSSVSSGVNVTWVAIYDATNAELSRLPEFRWSSRRGLQPVGTLYFDTNGSIELISKIKSEWSPTMVPCKALWGAKGRLEALLQLLYYPKSTL